MAKGVLAVTKNTETPNHAIGEDPGPVTAGDRGPVTVEDQGHVTAEGLDHVTVAEGMDGVVAEVGIGGGKNQNVCKYAALSYFFSANVSCVYTHSGDGKLNYF